MAGGGSLRKGAKSDGLAWFSNFKEFYIVVLRPRWEGPTKEIGNNLGHEQTFPKGPCYLFFVDRKTIKNSQLDRKIINASIISGLHENHLSFLAPPKKVVSFIVKDTYHVPL